MRRLPTLLAILAAALWSGGLIVLGAVVAPVVFRHVPAPMSADAMTLVFRRFDMIAMTCSGIVLFSEPLRLVLTADRAAGRPKSVVTRLDMVRIATALVAAGLAVWQGIALSPKIEALHRAGAVRGAGELGMSLEATHRLVEGEAKVQLLLVIFLIVLHVMSPSGENAATRR